MSQQGMSQQDMTGGQGPEEEEEEAEEEGGDQTVVHRVNNLNRIQPRDIMREGLDSMAQRMRDQPDESLEELKVGPLYNKYDCLCMMAGSRERSFKSGLVVVLVG